MVENPLRSLMWAIPGMQALLEIPGVFDVRYDACMFGGLRLKHQRLRTNVSKLADMAVLCDGSHDHLPWSSANASTIILHTSDETMYPHGF